MKALAKKSLLAICCVVLAVSCMDQPDPVSIDSSEIIAAADSGTAEMALAAATSSNPPVLKDPFGHRLNASFSVSSSSLVPNSSFTITLSGTATSAVSGGSVKVVMPTVAAMQYAGAGKRPDYHLGGGGFPTVASWTLPSMRAGQSFSRSVSVGALENGYYQVVALIEAQGPDTDPYISDTKFEQAWLHITDGGGSFTRAFDKSVFPAGVAPLPGPHRNKGTAYTGGTSSAAYADDVGSDGDNDVYVRVLYVAGDNTKKAVGARLWAETVSDEDPEGSGTNYEARTVGSSGIVRFSCPGSGHFLRGAGGLPANSDVGSGGFTSYWDAYDNECGDTITVVGARRFYLPWIYLKEVVPEIEDHLSLYRSRISWRVDLGLDQEAEYRPSTDEIVFGSAYDRKFAAAHEFGHAMQEEKMGGIFQAENACYAESREFDGPTGYKCAFQEGFASYVAGIAAPDDTDHDFEDDTEDADAGWVEAQYEVNVAALFHDLIDDTTESGDYTDYPASYVVGVYKSCEVRVVLVWPVYHWNDRDDVSDYVWCLEETVNSSVHESNFPNISTPTNARDNQGRPSGWNANDIRRTWEMNVGT